MLFLTVEDLNGTLNMLLLPEVHRVVIFTSPNGMVGMTTERGEPFLRVDKVVWTG